MRPSKMLDGKMKKTEVIKVSAFAMMDMMIVMPNVKNTSSRPKSTIEQLHQRKFSHMRINKKNHQSICSDSDLVPSDLSLK